MPCDDELEEEQEAWDDVEDAEVALESAKQKLENRLWAALVACGIGAFGGIKGKLYVLLGLGGTCLAALLAADDAAADYELAVAKSQLAAERHFRALMEQLMCQSRCTPHEKPDNS